MSGRAIKMILNRIRVKIRNCGDKDYKFIYSITKKDMLELVEKNLGKWDARKFKKDFNKKNIKIVEHNKRRVGLIDFREQEDYIH